MRRHVGSLLIGVLVGLAIGIYLGWVQFPVEYINSSIDTLASRYQEEYTVMVAEGYLIDREAGEVQARKTAEQRLEVLGKEDIGQYVKELTHQYIENSNSPPTIQKMIELSEAMGVLTERMQDYRSPPAAPNQ